MKYLLIGVFGVLLLVLVVGALLSLVPEGKQDENGFQFQDGDERGREGEEATDAQPQPYQQANHD